MPVIQDSPKLTANGVVLPLRILIWKRDGSIKRANRNDDAAAKQGARTTIERSCTLPGSTEHAANSDEEIVQCSVE